MLTPSILTDIASNLRDLARYVERTTIDSLHDVCIPFSEIRSGYPAQTLGALKTWSSSKARYIYQFSVEDDAYEELHGHLRKPRRLGKTIERIAVSIPRQHCYMLGAPPTWIRGSNNTWASAIKVPTPCSSATGCQNARVRCAFKPGDSAKRSTVPSSRR